MVALHVKRSHISDANLSVDQSDVVSDSAIYLEKACTTSPCALSTCSTWDSDASSLALQPASLIVSFDGRSDLCNSTTVAPTPATISSSNATRHLTLERKKWIEEITISNAHQQYSDNACAERKGKQKSSAVTFERRRWVEQTLLNNNEVTSECNYLIESSLPSNGSGNLRNNELGGLQQASLSSVERRQRLSGVTYAKPVSMWEDEVREEARLKEEIRMNEEEVNRAEDGADTFKFVSDEQKYVEEQESYKELVDTASNVLEAASQEESNGDERQEKMVLNTKEKGVTRIEDEYVEEQERYDALVAAESSEVEAATREITDQEDKQEESMQRTMGEEVEREDQKCDTEEKCEVLVDAISREVKAATTEESNRTEEHAPSNEVEAAPQDESKKEEQDNSMPKRDRAARRPLAPSSASNLQPFMHTKHSFDEIMEAYGKRKKRKLSLKGLAKLFTPIKIG